MHNRDKYPEIWAAFEAAKAELEPYMAARKVETDKIKKVQAKIDALQADKAALNEAAMVNIGEIKRLRGEISRMALAMGAVRAGAA